jgi:uncharacterized protein (DUF1778 family)
MYKARGDGVNPAGKRKAAPERASVSSAAADRIAKCAAASFIADMEVPMPRAVERKERPLSIRLPEADIAIIDRAAVLRGRSRTDFVREAAVRAAEDVLMETASMRMSAAGFKAFMAAVSGPAKPAPEMVELFRRAAPWEAGRPKNRR